MAGILTPLHKGQKDARLHIELFIQQDFIGSDKTDLRGRVHVIAAVVFHFQQGKLRR